MCVCVCVCECQWKKYLAQGQWVCLAECFVFSPGDGNRELDFWSRCNVTQQKAQRAGTRRPRSLSSHLVEPVLRKQPLNWPWAIFFHVEGILHIFSLQGWTSDGIWPWDLQQVSPISGWKVWSLDQLHRISLFSFFFHFVRSGVHYCKQRHQACWFVMRINKIKSQTRHNCIWQILFTL